MKRISQKFIWLVVALPLTGCGSLTSIPLYEDKPVIKHAAPVIELDANSKKLNDEPKIVKELKEPDIKLTPEVNIQSYPIDNASNEIKKLDSVASSTPKEPLVVGVAPLNPEDVKDMKAQVGGKQVIVDQSVKLIAPPTALPKTRYAVPQVEEKEDYVPRKYVSSKKSTKVKVVTKKSKKQKISSSKKSSKKSKVGSSTTKNNSKKQSKTKK